MRLFLTLLLSALTIGLAPAVPAPADTATLGRWLQLTQRQRTTSPDSAAFSARQALALARQLGLPARQAQALDELGWLRYVRGDYPGALRLYQQALALARQAPCPQQTARLHDDIGKVLCEQGAYPEALDHHLQALRYYGSQHDSTRYARGLQNLASVEYREHNLTQAIAYHEQAIRLLRKNKDPDELDTSYQDLALIYADQGHFGAAERYMRLGLAVYQRQHDRINEAIALNNLGDIYLRQRSFGLAYRYFGQALALAQANHDQSMLAVCEAGLAQVLEQQHDYPRAERYARHSLQVATSIRAMPVAQQITMLLASILAGERQYEPALALYKQGKAIEDSIFGLKHTAQVEMLRMQYQRSRREQEEAANHYLIQQLEREQRADRLTLLLLGGVCLSVLALAWLWRRQLQAARQRDQARLEARAATEEIEQLRSAARLQEAEYELGLKNRKLTSLALAAMQQGEFLHEVKERLDAIGRTADDEVRRQLTRLRQSIEQNGPATKDWEQFRLMFEEVHQGFFSALQQQYPDVTPNELRLAALLKLNFSSKAMAGLLGISEESIKKARYRLRQKLQLPTSENLADFIMKLEVGKSRPRPASPAEV